MAPRSTTRWRTVRRPTEYWDPRINPFVTYGWPAYLLSYVNSNTTVFRCPSTGPEFEWPANRSSRGYLFPFNIGTGDQRWRRRGGWRHRLPPHRVRTFSTGLPTRRSPQERGEHRLL
jgi:hypothetical protein